MLYSILTIALVLVAALLIGLILLQQGKGADAGAAFGSGASGTVFGAGGSGNFLSRTTWVLAGLFFLLAIVMAYVARHSSATPTSVMDKVTQPQLMVAPASITAKPAVTSPSPAAATKH
ncbi:MAG TPA: preprotein translocase subunit SecG [Gammaproteobacteria bacterium]|jgi:preprotein translocase subunit SecG